MPRAMPPLSTPRSTPHKLIGRHLAEKNQGTRLSKIESEVVGVLLCVSVMCYVNGLTVATRDCTRLYLLLRACACGRLWVHVVWAVA
jgi:hypothetical protein